MVMVFGGLCASVGLKSTFNFNIGLCAVTSFNDVCMYVTKRPCPHPIVPSIVVYCVTAARVFLGLSSGQSSTSVDIY